MNPLRRARTVAGRLAPDWLRREVGNARQRRDVQRHGAVTDNVGYNRSFWNQYSDDWDRGKIARPPSAQLLGEEWSDGDDFAAVFEDWIAPELTPEVDAGELGPGGGRVAVRVAPSVRRLHCFDISEKMLDRTRLALADHDNVDYTLLDTPELPANIAGTLDFVYSFDVFVHLDLHTMWRYVQQFATVLRPGGRALLHTANLTAPGGWQRFAGQDRFSVQNHYFVTPEVVRTLAHHAGFELVRESHPSDGNLYLWRDYLVLLARPADQSSA